MLRSGMIAFATAAALMGALTVDAVALATAHTAPQGNYTSSKSDFLPSRLTSPGLIPGPTNSFPDTSATASASSPSFTGTLLRTNSMAPSLSDSYARKFRTIRGFPSESKVVTRMFHPAGILMRRNCRRSMTCLIQTDLVRHRGLIIPGLSPNESNAD